MLERALEHRKLCVRIAVWRARILRAALLRRWRSPSFFKALGILHIGS
jgi:hypothetical protein